MSRWGRRVLREPRRRGVVPRSSGVEEFLGGSSPAQGLWLVRPGMRRLELLAATSPRLRMGSQSFFFFFSQLLHGWAIRSKGKAFPKSQLDGAGRRRRVFFPPSSLWKIRLRRWRGKEAVRGLQDQDQDPQLMDRGLRLLALPAALASSQVGSPPGVATPASTYSRTVGGWGGTAALEMLESQLGWGDKSYPHSCVPGPGPPRPSQNWAGCPHRGCPLWDRKAHGDRP